MKDLRYILKCMKHIMLHILCMESSAFFCYLCFQKRESNFLMGPSILTVNINREGKRKKKCTYSVCYTFVLL